MKSLTVSPNHNLRKVKALLAEISQLATGKGDRSVMFPVHQLHSIHMHSCDACKNKDAIRWRPSQVGWRPSLLVTRNYSN